MFSLGKFSHVVAEFTEAFSMGDIPAATSLYRYFEMGLVVEKPAHLMAWYQRLSARRAFRQTIMTDFSELQGREQY